MVSRFPVAVLGDPPRDLPDLLGRLVRLDPSAPAVIDVTADRRSVPLSRAALWLRTVALVDQLRDAGVAAGDCVAVWLPNWSDALCWQFATAALGAHVIGVNTRYNTDEVTHLLDSARPRLVAVAHGFHGLDLREKLVQAATRSESPTPAVAVVTGPGPGPDAASHELPGYDLGAGVWSPAPASPDPLPKLPPSDPSALAVAFTTSGSTGRPKLAAHRGVGVLGHAVADATAIGLAPGDVLLCGVPLAGTFGFSAAMAALAGGATVLLEPVFDADGVLDDMASHRVSHVVGGDDLGLRLQRAWRTRPRDLPAWRWWGAANFQGRLAELAQWAERSFGTATAGLYGSSEVFALTAMWPADEPAPRRWEGGGRVVSPEILVRAADPDNGAALAAGQEGELQFVGPNVVDGYLGNPEAAARAFTEDGWFRSGDLGYIVEEGVFVYTCRMGDALRLRGFLVDPSEIEARLAEHPGVDTAKVVGIPGPDGGTRAIGFVVPAEAASPAPEELREWCGATLAKFKVPDAVHLIDAMPTIASPNGNKILKTTLVEWARERS
ncbi:MAG TPA: AMP-binding protein [Pseudonocardia sp.]|uniref:AMP-binding protein n=1 Tax=Pseudonocardia sp. TaxID=60912 RepID=UPI002ED92103